MESKPCKICGRDLNPGARLYCSIKCRSEGRRRETRANRRPCEACGQPVKTNDRRFCSHKCAGKEKLDRHPCAQCGTEIRLQREFCSRACYVAAGRSRLTAFNCSKCGKEFTRYKSQRVHARVYCSNECRFAGRVYARGKDHPQWQSGTYVGNGYLYEIDYTQPPKPDGSYRYRSQHNRVAEEVLGRPLVTGEHVHHINGNKLDNRPENLLVLPASKHRALHGYYAQRFQQEHDALGDLAEITMRFVNSGG